MEITERVAYLKGLAEAQGQDTESKQGKLISMIIDILDDVALELQDHQDQIIEISEGLDAVSDDLEDVEEIVYEDDDEFEDDEDDDDSEDCYATTCPTCEETVYFDESILEEGEVVCPNCGEKLEFDLTDIEDCDCGEDHED